MPLKENLVNVVQISKWPKCRRKPSQKEKAILTAYFKEQLTLFQNKKLDAVKTLSIGASELNRAIDLNKSAALMKVVSTIYNLEEAITKS